MLKLHVVRNSRTLRFAPHHYYDDSDTEVPTKFYKRRTTAMQNCARRNNQFSQRAQVWEVVTYELVEVDDGSI